MWYWYWDYRLSIIWQTTHRYDQHIPWAEYCRRGRRSCRRPRTERRSFRSGRRRPSGRPGRRVCWPPWSGRSYGDSASRGRPAGRRAWCGFGRPGPAIRRESAGGCRIRPPCDATPHRSLRDTEQKQKESLRMRKLLKSEKLEIKKSNQIRVVEITKAIQYRLFQIRWRK